jgi:HK97 family phage major capsid protein
MLRLSAAAGGNTITDIANGGMPMFLGYPVTFVQVMPSAPGVSTIGCYFGDLRLTATIGTRRATNTAVTTERYFEFDLIGIRSTERVAINVHERGADVRTRPMVALKNAAS